MDLADWVDQYPELRHEIIDFWLFVRGTPRDEAPPGGDFPSDDNGIAEGALRDACLAINLGEQWLEPAFDRGAAEALQLAGQLESLRRRPRTGPGKAPVAFRKAVVWSWVVSVLEEHDREVSRITVQKIAYMLETSMELGVFNEYRRHLLGPYDHRARYRDAEPIAIKKNWLIVEGTRLRSGVHVSGAIRYAARYLRSERTARELVSHLSALTDAQLECLATVHWTALDLITKERPVSPDDIREALRETAEWRPKLRRPTFSKSSVGSALWILRSLRLLPNP